MIETSEGQSHLGLIKSNIPEGLLLLDVAGQTQLVPHPTIVANTALPTSLMPAGLEQTMSQQELLDLVAWLASRK